MKFLDNEILKKLQPKFDDFQTNWKNAANDSPNLPYDSKYKAFSKLEEMQEIMNNLTDPECQEHIDALQSYILVSCGVIKAEVEELTMGEKFLMRSLELCDKVQEEKYTLSCRLSAHNQLGIIWCTRDEVIKSRQHLEKSLNIYFNFKNENSREIFLFEDLMYPDKYEAKANQEKNVEMLITHTYYYLAQVHGKQGNPQKSAEYCHETLDRQLQNSEYDPVDWCSNAAILSQFYLNADNFKSARYHLCSSLIIFEKHFDENKEEDEERKERIDMCRAHISRLCGKYGQTLLEYSHSESILAKVYKTIENVGNADDEAVENPEFADLDVSTKIEEVTDKKIVGWEDARKTFIWAQKHFTASQGFYTMNEKCSDYVEITRDMSQLYKHLIFFEEDNDRKSKMHRRRADLLEPVLNELSETHYLLVVRQILFELGEIFSDMMDLKTKRWNEEPNNPHHAKKVNMMVTQAVLYFTRFLDTMKVEGKHPDKYNEDTVRPALLARFHLGRLASKFVVEENTEQHMRNVLTTFTSYKQIVDYCTSNEDGAKAMEEEYEVCQEMVRLLPIKISKIRTNLKRP
eukprot:GFUD01005229.1.p1 GENE.GFUD01005229.1~~GFUD01005229.1.p1  ORF type:complete len:574 (-),score=155.75 GFUD01005229.1:89-1810(-)